MFTVKTPHEGEGFDVVVLDAEGGALNMASISEHRSGVYVINLSHGLLVEQCFPEG